MKTSFYLNIECGNVFPTTTQGFADMVREAERLYDYNDPTNCVELSEYYTIIEV